MLQETNKERGFLLYIVALWVISRRHSKRSYFFKKPHYVQIKGSAFTFLSHCWMEKSVHPSTSFKAQRPYLTANFAMACPSKLQLQNHCKDVLPQVVLGEARMKIYLLKYYFG